MGNNIFLYPTATQGSLICRWNKKPIVSYGYQTVTKLIEDLNDNNFLPNSISIGDYTNEK